MDRRISVLLVEDEVGDAELTVRALVAQGYEPRWQRVDSAADLRLALASERWDIVLSDFNLPGLTGVIALGIVKEASPDTPFIMVTGTIGEDNAAAIMKSGADDFILKGRMARLGPAVGRALVDARIRVERDRAVAELRDANQDLSALIAASPVAIIVLDAGGAVRHWNRSATAMFGWDEAEQVGRALLPLGDDPGHPLRAPLAAALGGLAQPEVEVRCRRKAGADGDFLVSLAPLQGLRRDSRGIVVIASDITERKALEDHARHALKMESIGQLSAGIAHEIRTPIQFIGDNLRFLQQSCQDLQPLFGALAALDAALAAAPPEPSALRSAAEAVARAAGSADVGYLAQELANAATQSLEGVERVATIVKSLKDFSHPDGGEMTAVDLRQAIDSTLTIARNEYKYVAELVTEFDPDLPDVECLQGGIGQVVLNLVVNAAHAIADAVGASGGRGTITVSARRDGEMAEIRVADTGTGIPEHARARIFSPFFTTKGVGRGTGQGLALAHAIIVKQHRGTIAFTTEPGKGTVFIIRIPLAQERPAVPGLAPG